MLSQGTIPGQDQSKPHCNALHPDKRDALAMVTLSTLDAFFNHHRQSDSFAGSPISVPTSDLPMFPVADRYLIILSTISRSCKPAHLTQFSISLAIRSCRQFAQREDIRCSELQAKSTAGEIERYSENCICSVVLFPDSSAELQTIPGFTFYVSWAGMTPLQNEEAQMKR